MTQLSIDKPAAWDDFCRNFRAAFGEQTQWKWDGRFGTVLMEFSVDEKDTVRTAVENFMTTNWNGSNLAEAPEKVLTINRSLGGMMPEQMLFTTDTDSDPIFFCAWWPWGNGRTISIRFAPFEMDTPDDERTQRAAVFKEIFGV